MDSRPIPKSKDLLLTIVSEARNSGFASETNDELSIILRAGRAPILIKETPVRIFMSTQHHDWTILAIDASGKVLYQIPYQLENKTLSFKAGTDKTLYYRLESHP